MGFTTVIRTNLTTTRLATARQSLAAGAASHPRLLESPPSGRVTRPNWRPFCDRVISDAFLACDNGIDGKILDQSEDARGHPTGQCQYLLERLDLQIGFLLEGHCRDECLDHVREIGIVAPVWQVMFVQPPGKLDITTDGIDGLADPEAYQRHFEFIAEIPQNIELAALFAVRPGQEIVDFVDHDHPQAKVAQECEQTRRCCRGEWQYEASGRWDAVLYPKPDLRSRR